MKDIVKSYWDLRDKAKRHGDEIAGLFHVHTWPVDLTYPGIDAADNDWNEA